MGAAGLQVVWSFGRQRTHRAACTSFPRRALSISPIRRHLGPILRGQAPRGWSTPLSLLRCRSGSLRALVPSFNTTSAFPTSTLPRCDRSPTTSSWLHPPPPSFQLRSWSPRGHGSSRATMRTWNESRGSPRNAGSTRLGSIDAAVRWCRNRAVPRSGRGWHPCWPDDARGNRVARFLVAIGRWSSRMSR